MHSNPDIQANVRHLLLLEKIANATPGMITVLNVHTGKYIYVNPRISHYVGYLQEDFMKGGADFFRSRIHPDDLPRIVQHRQEMVEKINEANFDSEAAMLAFEYRFQKKNGDWIWLQTNSMVFDKNEEGKVEHLIHVSLDITDKKAAKEALKRINVEQEELIRRRTVELEEQRRQLNLILNKLPALVSYVDKDLRYRYLNNAYNDWFRTDTGHWLGRPVAEVLGEKAFANIRPYLEQALAGKELNYETYITYDDPRLPARHVHAHYIPDFDESGLVNGIFILVLDISAAVHAQKEVRESAGRFRSLIEAIPNIAWTALPNGQITYCNRAWYEYTGAMETTGWDWQRYIYPEDHQRSFKRWNRSLSTGGVYETEYRWVRHDGAVRWMLGRANPIRNKEGEITLWIGTATDIHDQKQQQSELKWKNKELKRINADLDTVLYTVCHDLNAPVSNIEGLLGVLQDVASDELKINPDFKGIAELIAESVVRFKHTIRDFSDLNRMERNKAKDIQEIDLQSMIGDIRDIFRNDFTASGATLNLHLEDCPTIRFSRQNLRSILFNLLSNAIKYRSPERLPLIEVSAYRLNEELILSVKDNGLGIPTRHRDKIFSLFKRFHTHVDGSGIGLYIVRRTVENAGGHIELESEEGEGSVFRIFLKEPPEVRDEVRGSGQT